MQQGLHDLGHQQLLQSSVLQQQSRHVMGNFVSFGDSRPDLSEKALISDWLVVIEIVNQNPKVAKF